MGLTKEEKKAAKEAKKLAKLAEEAEAARESKRHELRREIAMQVMKKDELDKIWREIMLKIKEPLFRKEVEVTWHIFERMLDKKDHLINYTMKLMETADDQFQRTIASFCVTIDTTINKFLDDLNILSNENDINTAKLLKYAEYDAMQIMDNHNAAETHLQLLLYHAHTTADTLAWTSRGENLVKEDEERNKYAHDRDNLTSILEDNCNSVWEEYKSVLKSYILETANNKKHVRKLKQRENLMADVIASQAKKIANSDGLLKRLRSELAAYESGTKQAVFRDRRNRHRAACFKMKKHMTNERNSDDINLALLVRFSDSTIEWLQSAAQKGEKILRVAAVCRKFESQCEKIMPYGYNEPHLSVNIRQTKSDDSLITNAMSTTCGLTRLWQRISKAELTRRALYREKMLLEQENAYIMGKIQDLEENKIEPKIQKYICGNSEKKSASKFPVAIEGVLELNKYKKT